MVLAAAMTVAAGTLQGQQSPRVLQEGGNWVEETRGSLPALPELAIKLDAGNVTVQGGKEESIAYVLKKRVRASSEAEARRSFDGFRLAARNIGRTAVLEVQAPRGRNSLSGELFVSEELLVRVPRDIRTVRAVTDAGNESVSDIGGQTELVTAGGAVRLDGIGGRAVATSLGGDIDVGEAGGDLVLKSGGGIIRVGTAKGSINAVTAGGNIVIADGKQAVSAETMGGSIEVKQCGGALTARTGGGTLQLGHLGGRATLQSAAGSIRLASAEGPVTATTGGGTIELFGLGQQAEVQSSGGEIIVEFLGQDFHGGSLQTPNGDVVVYLAPKLKATVQARVEMAAGHRLHSDFPEITVAEGNRQYGPGSLQAGGNLNGGGPVLKVRTGTGNIDFRRTPR
jgi:hypothetical protein